MKKIILIFLLLGTTLPALRAQQNTVHHMIITTYEYYGIGAQKLLIETHEDGTQTRRDIGFHNTLGAVKGIMQHEDTLMLALKPYFDQGWEVTASTAIQTASTNGEYITRFFLRKKD
jgi:hypothetical protein